jgi:hypothetical protein
METNNRSVSEGGREGQKARSDESLCRVETLLSQIRFSPGGGLVAEIVDQWERTVDFGASDRAGIDLVMTLSPEFGEFVGLVKLNLQVKSSEAGVEQFANTGRKKFGSTGEEWRRMNLILLNGQWVDGSIVADFLVQLSNLIGIYGDEVEMGDFVACFDKVTVTNYGHHYPQVEQYRCHLLEWVAGRPRKDEGGRVFYFS